MTVMTREVLNHEVDGVEIPVFAYGIDADNYEEAYAEARRLFGIDLERYREEHRPPREEENIEDLVRLWLANR